jgi:ABC-type branched-subunit amino acid transport system substrate-binding protein
MFSSNGHGAFCSHPGSHIAKELVVRSTPKHIAAQAVALATLAVLAGCSSTPAADGAGDEASEDTIKVMVFGSFTQPPFPLPQIQTGAEAAVERVNADGGINGSKIQLISCDDQGNANGAAACGREAVEEKVVAVVGSFTLFGDSIMQFLDKAKIPAVFDNATSQLESTSANSFPIVGAIPPSVAALLSFDQQGCTTTVLSASENAQSQAAYDVFFKPVADKNDIKTAFVTYPATTTDFSSVAAQIADAGDCLVYAGGAPDSSAIMLALQQSGAKIKEQAVLSTVTVSDDTLKQIGDVTNDLQLLTPGNLPTSGEETTVQAAKDITAKDSDAIVDSVALNAYAAILAIKQVGTGLDSVTGEALTTALADPNTTVETGIYPPINFSKDAGFYPLTPRVSGSEFYGYVAKDGSWERNEVADVDLADFTGKLG